MAPDQAALPGLRRGVRPPHDREQRGNDRGRAVDRRQRGGEVRLPRGGEERRHAPDRRQRPREPARRLRTVGGGGAAGGPLYARRGGGGRERAQGRDTGGGGPA